MPIWNPLNRVDGNFTPYSQKRMKLEVKLNDARFALSVPKRRRLFFIAHFFCQRTKLTIYAFSMLHKKSLRKLHILALETWESWS